MLHGALDFSARRLTENGPSASGHALDMPLPACNTIDHRSTARSAKEHGCSGASFFPALPAFELDALGRPRHHTRQPASNFDVFPNATH